MKMTMKEKTSKIVYWALALTLMLYVSCSDDDKPEPTFDPPTITITSPTIPAEGLEVEIGQTVDIVLSVEADAGLISVTANDQSIKSYGGTELSDEVTYQVSPTEEGTTTIEFEVTDSKEMTASASATIIAVEPPIPPFVLSDLAGEATGSEEIDVEAQGWDIRTVTTFTNTSSFDASTATLQFVASQGHALFAQDNPDEAESDKVLKVIGATEDGEGSWGGHYIFGMIDLGENIPVEELQALPQIEFDGTVDIDGDEVDDASVATVASGYTRVIQVDAYYDDTVNPNLTLNDIKQIQKIYGLDLSRGYQVDLALVNSSKHIDITTGEVQGFYTAYSAWIDEPNKWVTLTFEVASEAQQQFLEDGEGPNLDTRNPATIDEVDGVTLIPAYTHEIWNYWDDVAQVLDGDTNPLYFRNLRIVNVTE